MPKGRRKCQIIKQEISLPNAENENVAMTVNIINDNIMQTDKPVPRNNEKNLDDYGPDFELFDGDIQFMYYHNAFFC